MAPEAKRLLITGASGLLGYWLSRHLSTSYKVTGLKHTHPIDVQTVREIDLDLTDTDALARAFETTRPDYVVHTAGLTHVDQCEENPSLAKKLNVDATAAISRFASEYGSKLIHISTDHLFRGDRPLVTEEEDPAPLNEYARTKLEAERFALKSDRALVLRTNFFGQGRPWRASFSDWLLDSFRSGKPLTLFHDVYITPIALRHLCPIIEELMRLDATGILNVAGSERTSKYDFGMKVAKRFSFPTSLIQRISVDSVSLMAPRPKDMSLSTSKIERLLGRTMPNVEQGIATLTLST